MSRPLRLIAPALVLGLVLGACQSATTPSSAASAPPTPVVTAGPTTTPLPDVAALLRAQLAAITSGDQRLTGTLRVGDIQATFEGTQSTNGPDSSSSLSTTVGGVVSTEQRTKVAGARYVKRGNGPWLEDASPAGSADLRAAFEQALSSAVDLDATIASSAAHRLSSTVPSFDPSRYGFAAAGAATPGTGTITFRARADGTPLSVTIQGTWKAASGSATVEASLDLTIEFTTLNNRPRISAPTDVWTTFVSDRFGFSHAKPATFDHRKDKLYDYFIGPTASAGYFATSRTTSDGYELNTIAASELAGLKTALGAKTAANEALTLGGERARLLSVSGSSKKLGGKVTVYEAVAVRGKYFYVVLWVAPTDRSDAVLGMMRQLLATFAFSR
jgi:hypothetical protein